MVIQNPAEQREKIINTIKDRGPSLPVHIASSTGLNTIFAGAFLSELYSDKTIKISHMKVGGSPLYFLPGQEEMLEKFFSHLNSKEKEAFSLLKEKKLIEDSHLEPAIRVALRNLKDFAFPIAPIVNSQKILFWRFHTTPEEQAKQEIEKILDQKEIKIVKEVELPPVQEEIAKQEVEKIETSKILPIFDGDQKSERTGKISDIKPEEHEKPKEKKHREKHAKIVEKEITLLDIPETPKKPEKIIEKSEFVNNLLKFLETENIELVEEREFRKKDYLGIVRINSDLGKIKFLLVAKEKKSISDSDLIQALEKIQSEKLPILFVAPGSLNKKAQSYLENYSSLIKFKKI